MAKFGDIIGVALLGGAAYVAWQWWTAQTASATAATTATGTPATTPAAYSYTPPTAAQQLQTAANANYYYTSQGNMMNADQWNAVWNSLGQPQQLTSTQFDSLFFPNGRPPAGTAEPLMSLATFMSALGTQGISGVGGPNSKVVYVPVMLSGQRSIMKLPGSTTPAQLQSMLRTRKA